MKKLTSFYKMVMILSILLTSFNTMLYSQSKTEANIYGHVLDAMTHEHMPFVNIYLKGTTYGTSTNDNGHYLMEHLPVGKHTIVVSFMGYKTIEQEVNLEANRSVEMNFTLEENSVLMRDVVVSANRYEVDRKEAATIVNVLTPKLFVATNSVNLAEGLNYQPGLRVENTCQNCGVNAVRINGLEGKYSQILIDSRPVFSSLAGVYGLEQIPVSMIDRVEVIRGGGSAIFGSSAIGGVVNIITREPIRNSLEISNTTQLIGGKSWDNVTSMNAALVSSNRKVGATIFGMSRDRQGYDHDGDGYTELGKLKGTSLGMRAYYRFSNQSKLTAEYHAMHEFRRGGDSIDKMPHQVTVAEQAEHYIHGGGLTYDFISKNLKTRFSLYTSLQKVDRNTYYGTQYDINAYGTSKDFSWVSGGQYNQTFERLIFMPSEFVAGVEYSVNKLEDIQLSYNRMLLQDIDIASVFVQNEWKNSRMGLLLGARVDKHNLIDDIVVSPRANFRYVLLEELTARLSYSSGYRAPQAFDEDLHIMAVGGEVAIITLSPDLRPEYSNSFSGSLNWSTRIANGDFNILAEGFYTTLDDVFILKENGTDAQGNLLMERCNGSGAYVGGFNLEMTYTPVSDLNMQLGYTLQQSRYKEPEVWSENPNIEPQTRMFRTPDHYGFMTIDYTMFDALNIALSGTYTGSMLVQHFAGYIAEDEEVITPDFFDMGIKVAYDVKLSNNSTMQFNAGIKNIFNSYQEDLDQGADRDAGYIYGPSLPRTFFFGLKLGL
ncbi:MAG: TonB-dependent receptor [Lentimicrobiaceae bacterium]|nr:TonB-dependent receptor [Lentimicrobiaceae bacterium]